MPFFADVYTLVKQIPAGRVTTYGEIARALGTRDARRVGHALHANPDPTTPCHRVINKQGRLAPNYGFSLPQAKRDSAKWGGSLEQYARLHGEGVAFKDRNHVDLDRHFYPLLY